MPQSGLEPRKAPRQARAKATRSAIIEAAAQIIGQRGLSGFTTNAVAERAGVSIGSLYQYFPNKDALMVALIERQQDQQSAALLSSASAFAKGDLADIVRTLVRAAMQHHRDDPLLATAIDHEEMRLPISAMLDHRLDMAGAVLRSVFASQVHGLSALEIDRAVQTLPHLVRATVDVWANRQPPMLDIAEEEAVRAVLGYLRAAVPER